MYKVYAGKEPIDVIWGVSSFPWSLMVDQMEIVDKDLSDADIHLKYVATKANLDFKNNKNNPSLCLVRFQMMEVDFLIRCSIGSPLRSSSIKWALPRIH